MNRLISFEGIDGSGKTTQISSLEKRLKDAGYEVLILREPGGTIISENIRNILLDSKNDISSETEMMLFLSARSQMTYEAIVPALEKDVFVICDRFADSTLAYQGYGRGLNIDLIRSLNSFVTLGLIPQVTFYLNINATESMDRRSDITQDRMESEGHEFMNRVKGGYDQIAKDHSDRIMIIDGSQRVDPISEHIWKKLIQTYKELS